MYYFIFKIYHYVVNSISNTIDKGSWIPNNPYGKIQYGCNGPIENEDFDVNSVITQQIKKLAKLYYFLIF